MSLPTRRDVLFGLSTLPIVCSLGTRSGAQSNAVGGEAARLTDLGMTLTDEQRARGAAFLKHHISIDAHAHPGRFFFAGIDPKVLAASPVSGAPFADQAIGDLRAGEVTAAIFAAVADMSILQMTPQGIRAATDFKPGQALAEYRRQIDALKALLKNPALTPGLSPADLAQAQRNQRTAAIFAVEGGDFIEDQLDRVHLAHQDGVRVITLVHYHINQIGDIQTEAPVHNGMTPLGKKIVGEMNRAGILIDLAHAPVAVARDAVETSSKPVMVSHTNLKTETLTHPRFITEEHAKLIASSGGTIGAWPCGFGLQSFADFIDAIQRLVDAVGIDHVSIGTDMDANYKPVFRNYRDWSLIPAALLSRGIHEPEVAKIMGGNLLRVIRAIQA